MLLTSTRNKYSVNAGIGRERESDREIVFRVKVTQKRDREILIRPTCYETCQIGSTDTLLI